MSTVPPSGPTGDQPELPPRRQAEPQSVGENSPFASPQAYGHASGTMEGDATGGVIPYKNVPALLAYYLAVFSLIPCFGLFLGVGAFILGIMGLKARKKNPAVRGSVHAWIGIILGGLMALVWGAAMLLMFSGIVAEGM